LQNARSDEILTFAIACRNDNVYNARRFAIATMGEPEIQLLLGEVLKPASTAAR
jgi:hypothetical protein